MNRAHAMDGERLTAGAVLAIARKELRLSVADVARQLKLTPQQVEALEADAYDRLPGRVFARGFLRNYAQLLGIDPQPLLRSIEREMPRPELVELRTPSEIVMPGEDHARWPLYSALMAFIMVGALAVYEFGFNDQAGRSMPSPAVVVPETAGEPGAPSSRNADGVPAPHEKAIDPAAPGVPTAADAVLASAARDDAGAGDARGPKADSVAERQLHLRFDQDSWVEIRDGNNKVIFSKLSRAGRQERVTGTPPFKLTVGNARGVRLQYEDKPVDLAPHTGVAVARLTLR
jgi:cytoskeleton protein RodZ